MNLEELSIQDKIKLLEECLSKTMDDDYRRNSALGDYADETLARMRTELTNAKLMFNGTTRLSQLDYDQQQIAIANYNQMLIRNLMCFPEYQKGRNR